MLTSASKDAIIAARDTADTIVQIFRCKGLELSAQEDDCVYEEPSRLEVRAQIEYTLVDYSKLGKIDAKNAFKAASVRFFGIS